MQGCRDLRLLPALRLHPAGRENCRVTPAASPVADTTCLEHQRVLKQTSNSSSRSAGCQRDPTSWAFRFSVANALHDEERQRGPIPFLSRKNRSRIEISGPCGEFVSMGERPLAARAAQHQPAGPGCRKRYERLKCDMPRARTGVGIDREETIRRGDRRRGVGHRNSSLRCFQDRRRNSEIRGRQRRRGRV